MPTIIYVEDNHYNYRLVHKILSKQGFIISNAPDGLIGLTRIIEEKPDLILMDVDLPQMDGLQVTQKVRNHPDPNVSSIPIIALTAQAMWGNADKCFEAGCNAFIAKPVSRRELVAEVERFFTQHRKAQ